MVPSPSKINNQKQAYRKIVNDSSNKLLYLESVRGIAAFVVVIGHIIGMVYPAEVSGASFAPEHSAILARLLYGMPLGFVVAGHFAVVIFFILSGYVLTYKYFLSRDTAVIYRQAAKRYFRLAIPVFFSVMLGYIFMRLNLMHNAEIAAVVGSREGANVFNFAPSLVGSLYDATIGVFAKQDVKYNPVLWTMPIELLGSFVIFGLAPFFLRLRHRWAAYAIAIIMLNISYFTCFILGMMIADIVVSTNFIVTMRKAAWPLLVYGLLVAVWAIASMPYPGPDSQGTLYSYLYIPNIDQGDQFRIWQFAGGAMLLIFILCRQEIQKILSVKILVFLGSISFSIYLTHYLIVNSLGAKAFLVFYEKFSYMQSALLMALVVLTVAIPVAVLWNKYIDKMAVSLSRRVAAYLLSSSEK